MLCVWLSVGICLQTPCGLGLGVTPESSAWHVGARAAGGTASLAPSLLSPSRPQADPSSVPSKFTHHLNSSPSTLSTNPEATAHLEMSCYVRQEMSPLARPFEARFQLVAAKSILVAHLVRSQAPPTLPPSTQTALHPPGGCCLITPHLLYSRTSHLPPYLSPGSLPTHHPCF